MAPDKTHPSLVWHEFDLLLMVSIVDLNVAISWKIESISG